MADVYGAVPAALILLGRPKGRKLRGCSIIALVPGLLTTSCDIVFQHVRTGTAQLLAGTLMGSGAY